MIELVDYIKQKKPIVCSLIGEEKYENFMFNYVTRECLDLQQDSQMKRWLFFEIRMINSSLKTNGLEYKDFTDGLDHRNYK